MAIFDDKTQDDRHLGPRLPRGLRLGRHCPLQVLRQSHIFHLEEQIWEQGTHIWFLFGHLVSSPRLAQCQCPKGRLQCRSSSESEYFNQFLDRGAGPELKSGQSYLESTSNSLPLWEQLGESLRPQNVPGQRWLWIPKKFWSLTWEWSRRAAWSTWNSRRRCRPQPWGSWKGLY